MGRDKYVRNNRTIAFQNVEPVKFCSAEQYACSEIAVQLIMHRPIGAIGVQDIGN